jgi:hypothetical protein
MTAPSNIFRRSAWIGLAALPSFSLALSPALAQGQFPSRAIRIVSPFAAGSVSDISMRLFADRLAARLSGQVVVDNQPRGARTSRQVFDTISSESLDVFQLRCLRRHDLEPALLGEKGDFADQVRAAISGYPSRLRIGRQDDVAKVVIVLLDPATHALGRTRERFQRQERHFGSHWAGMLVIRFRVVDESVVAGLHSQFVHLASAVQDLIGRLQ